MGSGGAALTVIVALITAVSASLVTGLFARPKTRADASVAISGDARAWAQTFAERAEKAEARADVAAKRAEDAEDRCEQMVAALAAYTRLCQGQIVALGGRVPDVPPSLSPPL